MASKRAAEEEAFSPEHHLSCRWSEDCCRLLVACTSDENHAAEVVQFVASYLHIWISQLFNGKHNEENIDCNKITLQIQGCFLYNNNPSYPVITSQNLIIYKDTWPFAEEQKENPDFFNLEKSMMAHFVSRHPNIWEYGRKDSNMLQEAVGVRWMQAILINRFHLDPSTGETTYLAGEDQLPQLEMLETYIKDYPTNETKSSSLDFIMACYEHPSDETEKTAETPLSIMEAEAAPKELEATCTSETQD